MSDVARPAEHTSDVVVRMLKENRICGLELEMEGHEVLAIGYEGNNFIVYDPLGGEGDTQLRKISMDNDKIGVWAIVKAADTFAPVSTQSQESAPRIKFGF